jgi:hypothetical protein
MSPAERARLIDKQEFEAESKALLARALAYSRQKQQAERQRVLKWIGSDNAPMIGMYRDLNRRSAIGGPKKLHTAQGITLTLQEWADHIGISYSALESRIRRLGSLEQAIALKPKARRAKRHTTAAREPRLNRGGKKPTLHEVNGVTLTIRQWAERLGIKRTGLQMRIKRLGSVEAAIAYKPTKGRWAGVASNFPSDLGTGAGSTAQETPNITFSEEP